MYSSILYTYKKVLKKLVVAPTDTSLSTECYQSDHVNTSQLEFVTKLNKTRGPSILFRVSCIDVSSCYECADSL